MKSLLLLALALPAAALADTTGPGAPLTKLDDRWVSIPPSTTSSASETPKVAEISGSAEAAVPATTPETAPAPEAAPAVEMAPAEVTSEAAPASLPGYTPDANYSGACHVTVDLAGKTYTINETSSIAMVKEAPAGKVCLPSESLARDFGFSKLAR